MESNINCSTLEAVVCAAGDNKSIDKIIETLYYNTFKQHHKLHAQK